MELTREQLVTAFAHSLVIGLYLNEVQIGLARTVTDEAVVAYLCDVVIDPQYRGKGLGQWLVGTLGDHPRIRGCRMLLLTRDAQTFYRRLGFETHTNECMRRKPTHR